MTAKEALNGMLGKILLLALGITAGGGGSLMGAKWIAPGDVPGRSEVREMISVAIGAVKERQGLDRDSMLEWKADQKAALEGLRSDVRELRDQQTRTNVLLESFLKDRDKT